MSQTTDCKKLGVGSASLILSIFGVIFSFTSWKGKYLGEHILNKINISFPYGLLSLVILFTSFFIGYRYKNDYFATSGRRISIVFSSLIVILSIIKQLLF